MKKQGLILFFACLNLFAISLIAITRLSEDVEITSQIASIIYTYTYIHIYQYLTLIYFWIPVSFYYAWKHWTTKLWLAFWINIIVFEIAWQFCGVFPMCVGL